MNERLLTIDQQFKDGSYGSSQMKLCDSCGEPTTHGTTDSIQAADGSWSESAQRLGCLKHPVQPMVRYSDGRLISFAAYQETLTNWLEDVIEQGHK
jgi:hypothetical protein